MCVFYVDFTSISVHADSGYISISFQSLFHCPHVNCEEFVNRCACPPFVAGCKYQMAGKVFSIK